VYGEKKVIGLVHTRFGPTGGVETYLNKLVPSLLERNWRVHYVTARIQQPILDGMILHKIPILGLHLEEHIRSFF